MPAKKQKKTRRPRTSRRNKTAPARDHAVAADGSASLNTGMFIKTIPLFPFRTRKVLQYWSPITITSGAGAAGTYVFSCNGLYDPDITSTGGQPMGFDQMMVQYDHYTVLRSELTVIIRNFSATYPITTALSISASASPTTSIQALVENGNLQLYDLEKAGIANCSRKITRRINIGKFVGVPNVLSEQDMRGTSSANPTEQCYFHISVYNSADTTAISANAQVYMRFEVMFTEPRRQTISGLPSTRGIIPHPPCESKTAPIFQVVQTSDQNIQDVFQVAPLVESFQSVSLSNAPVHARHR